MVLRDAVNFITLRTLVLPNVPVEIAPYSILGHALGGYRIRGPHLPQFALNDFTGKRSVSVFSLGRRTKKHICLAAVLMLPTTTSRPAPRPGALKVSG